MKKWHVLYLSAFFAEAAFLIVASVLSIYYLLCGLTIDKIDTIVVMIRLTRLIALLLMPLEAILYRVCLVKPKEKAGFSEMPEIEQLHRFHLNVQYVFVGIWFLYWIVFLMVVEGGMGLERGDALYVLLRKSGSFIIWPSLLGLGISDVIIYGMYAKKRA